MTATSLTGSLLNHTRFMSWIRRMWIHVSPGQVVLGIPTQGEHEIRHHQTDGNHGFEITNIGGLAYQAYRLQVK